MKIDGNDIQVCCYEGDYPNHNELDNWFVNTKWDAYESICKDKERNKGEDLNYRVVDMLNRFKPLLILMQEPKPL